ncbi:MAG: GNAT family protein [Lachnospiraceae bacterium]|nr:GNAT family protein [Lachnospiraceae bacterium]
MSLRLRPFQSGDAAAVVSWLQNERSFYQWSADRYGHYPITAEEMERYYAPQLASGRVYPMTAFDESGPVGHVLLRFPDEELAVLRFGFIVVDSAKRGRGYGREMLELALLYAFRLLKASKVTLGVFENNPAAYRCYRSLGFSEVKENPFVCFSILGEEWRCLELELSRERWEGQESF